MKRVLILGGLSAFGPLSIDMYLPGLPHLTHDLGATPSTGQLTLTACVLGLALGQLLAGPLSDNLGRRRPLLVGLAAYAVTSAVCALAPTVSALIALRFLQGLAGAAGIVIARAVVRDLYRGEAAARMFALLMLVLGIAPVFAPLIGGQALRVMSWRGIFVVLAGIGLVLLAARRSACARRCRPRSATRPASAPRCGPSACSRATAASCPTPPCSGSPSARCSPTSRARRSCSRTSTASRRRCSA